MILQRPRLQSATRHFWMNSFVAIPRLLLYPFAFVERLRRVNRRGSSPHDPCLQFLTNQSENLCSRLSPYGKPFHSFLQLSSSFLSFTSFFSERTGHRNGYSTITKCFSLTRQDSFLKKFDIVFSHTIHALFPVEQFNLFKLTEFAE